MTENMDVYEINLPTKYSLLHQGDKRKVRKAYIKLQNNKCYYCKTSLDDQPPKRILNKKLNMDLFPENFLKYPHHLHHDHSTDLTLGVTHAYCNGVLWQFYGL